MTKKIIAAVLVVILMLAGIGAFLYYREDKPNEFIGEEVNKVEESEILKELEDIEYEYNPEIVGKYATVPDGGTVLEDTDPTDDKFLVEDKNGEIFEVTNPVITMSSEELEDNYNKIMEWLHSEDTTAPAPEIYYSIENEDGSEPAQILKPEEEVDPSLPEEETPPEGGYIVPGAMSWEDFASEISHVELTEEQKEADRKATQEAVDRTQGTLVPN